MARAGSKLPRHRASRPLSPCQARPTYRAPPRLAPGASGRTAWTALRWGARAAVPAARRSRGAWRPWCGGWSCRAGCDGPWTRRFSRRRRHPRATARAARARPRARPAASSRAAVAAAVTGSCPGRRRRRRPRRLRSDAKRRGSGGGTCCGWRCAPVPLAHTLLARGVQAQHTLILQGRTLFSMLCACIVCFWCFLTFTRAPPRLAMRSCVRRRWRRIVAQVTCAARGSPRPSGSSPRTSACCTPGSWAHPPGRGSRWPIPVAAASTAEVAVRAHGLRQGLRQGLWQGRTPLRTCTCTSP